MWKASVDTEKVRKKVQNRYGDSAKTLRKRCEGNAKVVGRILGKRCRRGAEIFRTQCGKMCKRNVKNVTEAMRKKYGNDAEEM